MIEERKAYIKLINILECRLQLMKVHKEELDKMLKGEKDA